MELLYLTSVARTALIPGNAACEQSVVWSKGISLCSGPVYGLLGNDSEENGFALVVNSSPAGSSPQLLAVSWHTLQMGLLHPQQ